MVSPSYSDVTGGVENLMQKIVEHSSYPFRILTEGEAENPGIVQIKVKRLRGFIQTTRYILKHRPSLSLVYVSTARLLHLLLVPFLFGMGTICHTHGRDIYLEAKTIKTALRKGVAIVARRLGVRFIAVSDWTKEQLVSKGAYPDRTHVVPNGVELGRFRQKVSPEERDSVRHQYKVSKEQFLLLTVARLDPRKGHRFVIESLPHLPDCNYLIVGTGPEEKSLRELAANHGVLNRVHFAGFVTDENLPRVYQACDLFVMPSEHISGTQNVEGFGISFLEANAAGKAVVGTRTGGIPTAIQHNETGLLCEPTEESVLKAIRRLKDDTEFRRDCERQAVDWARKHSWSRVIEGIDEVIRNELKRTYGG